MPWFVWYILGFLTAIAVVFVLDIFGY